MAIDWEGDGGSSRAPSRRINWEESTSAPSRKKKGGGGGWRHGWKRIAADAVTFGLADPSVTHLAGNFGRDAGESITGLYPGLKKFGHAEGNSLLGTLLQDDDRIRRGERELTELRHGVEDSYRQTYGPLSKGDFGEFGHRLYDHPLSPLLDALTVATLGAGGVAKGASIISKGGKLDRALNTRTIELSSGGTRTITKQLGGTTLNRTMRRGADQAFKALDKQFQRIGRETPVFGETARYGRVVAREGKNMELGLQGQNSPYLHAAAKLSKKEQVAANALMRYPTKTLFDEFKASLPETDPRLKLLNDPKVNALYEAPNKKLARYLDEAENASLADAEKRFGMTVKKRGKMGQIREVPVFTRDAAEQRRYLDILMTRGAKMIPDPSEVGKLAEKFGGEDQIPAHFLNDLPTELVAPEGKTIPEMIDEARQEIAAAGGREPIYTKHIAVKQRGGQKFGTGGSVPPKNDLRQNKAVLFDKGMVAFDLESLSPALFATNKAILYRARHDAQLDAGIRTKSVITDKSKYTYVKQRLGENMGYTDQNAGEFAKRLGEVDPKAPGPSGLADDLTTDDPAKAFIDADGNYVVIPVSLQKKIVGDYTRSSRAYNLFWKRPTDVWRALVLNLRVGWLTNNIAGNSMLYAIRNAGPDGLKTYLQAVSDTLGPATVRKLLTDKEIRSHLTPEDIVELFPEQAYGAFMSSQLPDLGASRLARGLSKVSRYTTKPLRDVDVSYEQAIRRAMINRLIRRSPEFRKVWRDLPKQTREFRTEAKKFLDDSPEARDRISREVNDAMGDFLSLTSIEQGALRAVIPFYAWFREITRITLRLPLEAPVRTNLLVRLGEIGWGEASKELGTDELEGYLHAIVFYDKKGDTAKGFNTAGLNPFSTLVQLGEAAGSLSSGDPHARRNLQGLLHPGITATGNWLFGGQFGDPKNFFEGGLLPIGENLPQVRAYNQIAGNDQKGENAIYGNPSWEEVLAGYLGAPIKRVNVPNARSQYRP